MQSLNDYFSTTPTRKRMKSVEKVLIPVAISKKRKRSKSAATIETIEERNLLSSEYSRLPNRTDIEPDVDRTIQRTVSTLIRKKRSDSPSTIRFQTNSVSLSGKDVQKRISSRTMLEQKVDTKKKSNTKLLHLSNDYFSSHVNQVRKHNQHTRFAEPTPKEHAECDRKPIIEVLNNSPWLTSGSLQDMVEFMGGESQNIDWVHSFLLTFSYHTTSEELMKTITNYFLSFEMKDNSVNLVQLRLIRILCRWKTLECYQFSSLGTKTFAALRKFTKNLRRNKNHPLAPFWANELQKGSRNTISVQANIAGPLEAIETRTSFWRSDYDNFMLSASSREIAKQLTLIDHSFLCAIGLNEMILTRWTKEKSKHQVAPNVLAYAKRFNSVSSWVATEILTATCSTDRLKLLERFIKLEHHLLGMNNFNSIMAIHAGLNFHEISRLRFLWRAVSEKSMRKFQAIETMMDPLQNFALYRERLRNTKPPFIPFQSRVLGDLMSIEQLETYNEHKQINFYKLTDVAKVLKLTELSQCCRYPFTEVCEIQSSLRNIESSILSRDFLFSLSEQILKREEANSKIN